jgi:hypothetical protein
MEWLVVGDIEDLDHNCCTRCASRAGSPSPKG